MSAVERDEPAVLQPDLAALVDLAHRRRPKTSKLRADEVARLALEHRATRRNRTILLGLAMAASVALVWFGVQRSTWFTGGEAARDQASFESASHGARGDARDVEATPEPAPQREAVAPVVEPEAVVPPPVVVADEEPEAAPETPAERSKPSTTAEDLARAAERAMAERRSQDAIALLESLVRKFADDPATRAALLDLGRLRRAAGQADHARCAYATFRKRWPRDPMTAEVDRALAALGDGPACRGLRPRP